jgi:D-serine deaminase-like pyridoxal phosphate-dependent protein
MSQEHGIIKADENCFEKYNVGDVIGVIPIHSCMTADLFDQYATSEGRIMRL